MTASIMYVVSLVSVWVVCRNARSTPFGGGGALAVSIRHTHDTGGALDGRYSRNASRTGYAEWMTLPAKELQP
jgi:hypothetical protein